MIPAIPAIPSIPDGLREAAQIGKLVPFVGAGASMLAGCPSWATFATKCFDGFLARGQFTHAQLALMSRLNPRVMISIARTLQEEHKTPIDFEHILHPAGRTHPDGQRLYAAMSRLGTTFVTTNYDEWLDEALVPPVATITGSPSIPMIPKPRTVYHKRSDLTAAHLNEQDTVLHLHGSIKDPGGMILTTPDYVRHYANDRRMSAADPENLVLTFLDDLFSTKVVLFVGYSVEELEILEYVIVKTRSLATTRGAAPRHFLIQGFFSHELELVESLRAYYRSCGIELLPFSRDVKDYKQLLDVLEAFAAALPASATMVAHEFLEMERLLNG